MQTSPFFIIKDFAKVPSTAQKLRNKSTGIAVPVLFFQSTDGTGTKKVPRYCPPTRTIVFLIGLLTILFLVAYACTVILPHLFTALTHETPQVFTRGKFQQHSRIHKEKQFDFIIKISFITHHNPCGVDCNFRLAKMKLLTISGVRTKRGLGVQNSPLTIGKD